MMRVCSKWTLLFISINVCLVYSGQAQGSTSAQVPKVVGPSPNVAALQRYGDIPVSPYTGVPNISIPLYEVKAGSISVPISISYHASGIRVNDESSKVGLGWALNAGGVVSRTIVGEDDFISNGMGYHFTTTIADNPLGPRGVMPSAFNIQNGGSANVGGIANLPTLLRDGYNFQPDSYNFNVGDISGKFYMKRNKDIVLAKNDKLKFTCVGNGDSWQLLSPDGTKYLFEEFETYTETDGTPITSKTAWFLTKIISTNGDQVTFEYTIVNNSSVRPTGSLFESNNVVTVLAQTAQACGLVSDYYPLVRKESPGKDYKNVYLNKISFSNGEVRFVYLSDRIDVINDNRLSEVQIHSKNESGVFTLVKKFNLYQNYFSGTAYDWNNSNTPASWQSKRMRLDSLVEIDPFGNRISPYVFSYQNTTSPSNNESTLPVKNTFRRDHWGYYNGRTNNSLIPVFTNNLANDIAVSYIGIQGDNRDPNPTFAQLFLLNKITYPTGGRTEFEYESHDFDIEKSKLNDNSYFVNFPEVVSKNISKLYTPPISGNLPTATDLPNKLIDLSDLYVGNGSTTSQVSLSGFFRFNSNAPTCSFQPNNVFITLTKADGTIVSGPVDLASQFTCTGTAGSYVGINFSNNYNLAPGIYVWKIQITGTTPFADISLSVNYLGLKTAQTISNSGDQLTGAAFGGGLRIRRIIDYDGIQNVPRIKLYNYHSTNSSTGKIYSNGRRMNRPIYVYFDDSYRTKDCNPINIVETTHSQHLIYESDSNVPLNGSAGGNVIGYDTVEVFYGNSGEFGKTVYAFENQPDFVWNYSENNQIQNFSTVVPRKPPTLCTFPNIGNGSLLRQIDFEKFGNAFNVVKEVINTYSELTPGSNALVYGIEKRAMNNAPPHLIGFPFRAIVYPSFVANRYLLTKSIVRNYQRGDNTKWLEQETNYTYNNTTHFQLEKSSELKSNGEKLTTEIKYPLDYSDPNSDNAILEMKLRNMHAIPIEKKTVLTRTDNTTQLVLSAEYNRYQLFNGLVLPKETALLENTTPLSVASLPTYQPSTGTYPTGVVPRLYFESFNSNGDILQVRKSDDLSMSYVWDYQNYYPIAEVTNSSVNNIAHTSFESDGEGNWSGRISTSVGLDANAITGNKSYTITGSTLQKSGLSGTNVYTVSYWSKNGAYSVTGTMGAAVQGRTINLNGTNWTYYEHSVTGVSTVAVTGTGVIDELRLYPKTARMTTYTYEPLIGIKTQCDQNNNVMYYVYDGFGRLRMIKDPEGNILKTFDYKYQQQQ